MSKNPQHVQIATSYIGLTEDPLGSNRGGYIDSLQQLFGFRAAPWCAMFASDVSRRGNVQTPQVWSARAIDFAVRGYSYRLSDIIYNRYAPKPGDYLVKTRRGGNHVDIFTEWDADNRSGKVLGGNVSDAVTVRNVTLQSMIADGTTHITEVLGSYK